MSKVWFSSDTHFCHDRGFVYEPRGFSNVEEMSEAIVQRWNSVVAPEDTVYLLGDIMLNDNVKGIEFLKQLNGKIHILNGNHDTKSRIALYADCPNVIDTNIYAWVIQYRGYTFYVSHYPTLTSNLDNDAPLKKHVINLYGHTHQKTNFYQDTPFMYHVGLDSHDCYPVEIETIIADIYAKIDECKAMLGEGETDESCN